MTIHTPQLEAQNIPKLRFSGFSGVWEEKSLGDLCDVKGGKRIPLGFSLQKENNGFPYITVSDMNNGTVSTMEIKYVPEEVIKKIKNYTISKDDIYISVAGTLGLVGSIPKELEGANLTENANKLTNLKCNHDFLLQFLKGDSLKKLIESTKTSNAQPKLAIYALKSLRLNLPYLKEQQKIADFLSSIDELINNIKNQKENLEFYKKGIMQKIFSQEIRFKDKNNKDFPKWEENKLGDCLNYEQPTPYIVESVRYDNSYKIPVLTAGKTFILGYTNETNGIYNKNSLPVIIFDDFTTASQFVDFQFKVKSSAMKILKAKNEIDIKFLYEAMQLIRYEIGGHGRHWISKYSKIKINLPSFVEQQKIGEFLTYLDKVIELKNNQIIQAEQWKKGLVQGLFV